MNQSRAQTENETASAPLTAFLGFVILCLEAPGAAALQVAIFTTLAGIMVSYTAALVGQPSGIAFALAYIASSWGLYTYFRLRSREVGNVR